jgi:hypothetical protein
MKYNVCCIYDRVAQLYGIPNFVNTKGATIRAFADELNRPAENNQLHQHPDDFDLYYLGTFDDQECVWDMLPTPELLARGSNLKITKAP